MRIRAALLAAVLVLSVLGAAATPVASQSAEGDAYSGAIVQFETTGVAVTDYAVHGTVLVDNITMQSSGGGSGGVGVGADLGAVTDLNAVGLELASQTSASATVAFDSGARMEAHDNTRGVFQIRANGEDQVVHAGVSESAEAEAVSENRVVVRNDDGSAGTFIVVGDGDVTVNEAGNVTAEIRGDGQLVYRQYSEGRSDDARSQERLIENGTAAAEVYVHSAEEAGGEGEDAATSVVQYSQDTTVEVTSHAENEINMTAQRSQQQGRVIITTVSNEAWGSAESTEVFVDGEAAVQAESYSAVAAAADGGDQSRYLVRQSSSAEAATNVVVGVNHFSTRQVSMQSDGDGGDGDGGMVPADGPGFGALAALAAIGAALVAARYRA